MDEPGETRFRALAVHGSEARATLTPAHAERLCAGHFPGQPLVPGAALVGLMAEVAARAAGRPDAAPAEVVRAVFVARVHPRDPIEITARARAGRVDADVRCAGRRAARATFRFTPSR